MTLKQIPIKGLTGYYVNEIGEVWNYKKTPYTKVTQRISHGYLIVDLRRFNKKTTFYVHRLVLFTFSGKPKKNQECRHLDGNRQNAKLNNLKWGTGKENWEDRIKHGTHQFGEKNPNRKLNELQVKVIRKLIFLIKQKEIATFFDISTAQISRIKTQKRWAGIAGGNL